MSNIVDADYLTSRPLRRAWESRLCEIDILRTAWWNDFLSVSLRLFSSNALERRIKPEGFRTEDGITSKRNGFRLYALGLSKPNAYTLELGDRHVPGAADLFWHPLWPMLKELPVGAAAGRLLSALDPKSECWDVVHERDSVGHMKRRPIDWQLLRKLERRAGLDALFCLTSLLLEASRGERQTAFQIGQPLFNVLLVCLSTKAALRIGARLMAYYRQYIYPLATFDGQMYYLNDYNFQWAIYALYAAAAEEESRQYALRSKRGLQRVRTFKTRCLRRKTLWDVWRGLRPTITLPMGHPDRAHRLAESEARRKEANDEIDAVILSSIAEGFYHPRLGSKRPP